MDSFPFMDEIFDSHWAPHLEFGSDEMKKVCILFLAT